MLDDILLYTSFGEYKTLQVYEAIELEGKFYDVRDSSNNYFIKMFVELPDAIEFANTMSDI